MEDFQPKRGAVCAQTNCKRHSSHLRPQNALKTKPYHLSNVRKLLREKVWALSDSTNRELHFLHLVFSPPTATWKILYSSSANYSPAIDGSPRSSYDIRLVVKYPTRQPITLRHSTQARAVDRSLDTSTQSDLFLPISSYRYRHLGGWNVLASSRSFVLKESPLRCHPLLNKESLPWYTLDLQGWYPVYLTYDILRVFLLS